MKHIQWLRILLLPGLLLAVVLPLQGAYVWDTSTDPGYQAGNGYWDPYSMEVWNTDGTGQTLEYWVDYNDAVFSANGTSEVYVGYVSATSVQFDGTGYTLNGGYIENTGAYVMNQNATVSSELTGSLLVKGPGTLTLSGGVTTTNRIIICSEASTEGHVEQNGGTVAVTDEYFMVGGNYTGNCTAVYTINDGYLDNGYGLYVGWGVGSAGTIVQNGGVVYSSSPLNQGIVTQDGTASYYLNGGTLSNWINYLFADLDFYFGGGTFQPSVSFTTPAGLLNTTILDGATANIDTNWKNITWTDPIQGANAAGLAKYGWGTLTLAGDNTYQGTTTVYGGWLILAGTNTYQGGSMVYDGILQAVKPGALPGYDTPGEVVIYDGMLFVNAGGVGEWTSTDLVSLFSNVSSYSAEWGVGIDTTNAVDGLYVYDQPITGNIGLNKVGLNTLEVPATNDYTLDTCVYDGILKVTGSASLSTGHVYVRWNMYNAGGGGTIDLNGCTISNNFTLDGAGLLDFTTGECEGTINNYSAAPAEITGNVELGTTLCYIGSKASVGDIKISGQISGYTGPFKQGNNTLTLSRTDNTFDAPTLIEAGVLEVTKLANLGEPSSLGQPSYSDINYIAFYNYYGNTGQTLRYIGDTASVTDRVLWINAYVHPTLGPPDNIIDASGTTPDATITFTADTQGGGNVILRGYNTGDNTFSGDIVDGLSGETVIPTSLTKMDPGKWILDGVKSYTGVTVVFEGVLEADAIVNSPNVSVLGGELIAGSITTGTLTIGVPVAQAAPVPESSTMILLVAAGLGLLLYRRYRRQP
ncbi:MAG: autotransporter-associated beta strand repeat-containing protein [Pirellulales bacterium]|nr:autotransporter-associated beta strand repeat-containing protein [Pirellulales bacterium]